MNETRKSLDPAEVARARRRLGFVAMLWWIAALAGTLGLIQRLQASWVRVLFVASPGCSPFFSVMRGGKSARADLPE